MNDTKPNTATTVGPITNDEILEVVYHTLAVAEFSKKRGGHYLCMLDNIGSLFLRYLDGRERSQDTLVVANLHKNLIKIFRNAHRDILRSDPIPRERHLVSRPGH